MTAVRNPSSKVSGAVRVVGWFALLALGHLGLTAAGRTLPAPPPPWQVDEFLRWASGDDVAQTAFALLRLVGLVTVWYLAAISVLVVVARLSGLRPLAFLAHRLALPWARNLINHALGAGLALTLAGGIVPVAGAGLAGAATRSPVATSVAYADDDTVTMTPMDDDADAPILQEVPDATPGRSQPEAFPMSRSLGHAMGSFRAADTARETTWTIAAGDHLWHVAASTLEGHWQRPPTEAEIASYWTTLIDQNRGRLVLADQPDLVYPGQVFELPPVPDPGE
jgi:nucleoid-associated protein YgaU